MLLGYSLELTSTSPRYQNISPRARKLSLIEEQSLANVSSSVTRSPQSSHRLDMLEESPRALSRALAHSLPNSSLNSIMSAVADFGEVPPPIAADSSDRTHVGQEESSANAPNSINGLLDRALNSSPTTTSAAADVAPPNSSSDSSRRTPQAPALGEALAAALPNSSMTSIMSAVAELGEIEESKEFGGGGGAARSRHSQVASMLLAAERIEAEDGSAPTQPVAMESESLEDGNRTAAHHVSVSDAQQDTEQEDVATATSSLHSQPTGTMESKSREDGNRTHDDISMTEEAQHEPAVQSHSTEEDHGTHNRPTQAPQSSHSDVHRGRLSHTVLH